MEALPHTSTYIRCITQNTINPMKTTNKAEITILTDNLVYGAGLRAEHGFAAHIAIEGLQILFDTGQSDTFIHNAAKLGIHIQDIDYLILSHGHYDHTGGLYEFIKHNSRATIIAKPDIFAPKLHADGKNIGTNYNREALHHRLQYATNTIKLSPSVRIHTAIQIYNAEDCNSDNLYTEKNNKIIPDSFSDELFIVIEQAKISILTGCSHNGISNIIETAMQTYNKPIDAVIGGFHISKASSQKIQAVASYFNTRNASRIYTCHCTGIHGFTKLSRSIKTPIDYAHVGTKIYI